MSIITVGTHKQFATISAAAAAAHAGDIIDIDTGLYLNDFATFTQNVSLVAVGGQVTLQATAPMATGSALLTVTAGATINGFVFKNAAATSGIASGLLDLGGALTVTNSLFVGNQTGLTVGNNSSATVVLQGDEFSGNGNGTLASANISVGAIQSLAVVGSYVDGAVGGAEIRSQAQNTTLSNDRIQDNGAASGASIVLPNAGSISITNTLIEKGSASASGAIVSVGGASTYAGSSITVSNDTVVADNHAATLVQNQTNVVATVSNNLVNGLTLNQVASGPVSATNNSITTVRPAVSTVALVAPGAAVSTEYGRAGAVVANGTVLTVGRGGAYATLAQALVASHDGDTIDVAAGTYHSDGLTISHNVTIEGVGGMAVFAASAAPSNGVAQFVTTTDVTFKNVEITGVATPGGVSAAIHAQGGNLTVVNSYIHGNQAGIVADAAPSTSIGIYDTEIAQNGTADARGGNLSVGEVGTLTLRNDFIHDAVAGAEVKSSADNTVLDGDRISQAGGNGGADVALPNGGHVSITNSALEKGVNSSDVALLSVGGGTLYSGTAVSVVGNTLISDLIAPPTQFITAVPGSNLSVSGATFVGGGVGSVQVVGGTNTGATARTGLEVATGAPWGAQSAPVPGALTVTTPNAPGASAGVLVLDVSENAYQGNAQFQVFVDGQQVGGTLSATALHGAGQSQALTIAGSFAAGPHAVAVQFVNSLSGGTAGERDLFVDAMTFNGQNVGHSVELVANGSTTLSTGSISVATPVTVNLSETAFQGDASAFITIDGKVQGGLTTVTASHASGATQGMSFLLNLAPGAHSVGVTLLNPAGTGNAMRGLFVDSIDVAGAHYAAAAAHVAPTSNFSFTVAPPAASNAGLFLTQGLVQPASTLLPVTH